MKVDLSLPHRTKVVYSVCFMHRFLQEASEAEVFQRSLGNMVG